MGWIITKADRPDDARCKSCGYEFRHGDPIAILDDEVALDSTGPYCQGSQPYHDSLR